jgi:hypothetical protein
LDTDFHGFGRINYATTFIFLFEPTKTSFCGSSVQIRGNPCPNVIDAASENVIDVALENVIDAASENVIGAASDNR